jgi:hypothetical protein
VFTAEYSIGCYGQVVQDLSAFIDATTLSITTFSKTTFSIVTFSIMTLNITTFSIMTQHNDI